MKVIIENCNNIDSGIIEIKDNILNIKYAINGTGKTSIAKAIEYGVNKKDLNELKPFKYKDDRTIVPKVSGVDGICSIKIFNEDYVRQFVFQEDELIKNSFEIFIKTAQYDSGIEAINGMLSELKNTFNNDEELTELLMNLRTLSDCFGKSKSGYSAASSIGKGLAGGNTIENIPKELDDYSKYIKSDQNVKWLKWQLEGKNYLDIDNKCPYCTSSDIEKNKSKIEKLEQKYDSKVIEHLNKVLEVFNKLNKYFCEDVQNKIHAMLSNINGLKEEDKTLLNNVKNEIDTLISRLETIKNMGYITLKEIDKVKEKVSSYKINIDSFLALKSSATNKIIKKINSKLDGVVDKAGELQGEINKQNKYINELVRKYNKEINDFLESAGIKYNVSIELDVDNKYKLKFRHNDCEELIKAPTNYLSYGEKNAFALALFMYDALKDDPDLIILDDPISSFDKNKKYAIVNMLFRGKDSFEKKTVILLTHDFEPIIDIKYVKPDYFEADATYIENNNGQLKEKQIEKGDIKTFRQIVEDNINDIDEDVIKLIYLRRLYELDNNMTEEYNLISNLLHKRKEPKYIDKSVMDNENIKKAELEIKNYIPKFDYMVLYNRIIDDEIIKELYLKANNNYEKLQLFRILFEGKVYDTNDVVKKFINEAFHIENEYLFQLDPRKFEMIPNYIVKECDRIINELYRGVI